MDLININQTMYETFFSSIGILIGFLQAAIFQFTFDTKPMSKEKRRSLIIIFGVQEILLLSFFISLIFIYFFGTYVSKYPSTEKSLSCFMEMIFTLSGIFNTFILICIAAIFIYNLYLLLQELKFKQTWLWIILTISIIIFILFIFFTTQNKPLYFQEKATIFELLNNWHPL